MDETSKHLTVIQKTAAYFRSLLFTSVIISELHEPATLATFRTAIILCGIDWKKLLERIIRDF